MIVAPSNRKKYEWQLPELTGPFQGTSKIAIGLFSFGYISDSGLRVAPDNQAGIVLIDFDSGNARRLLNKHASVQPVPGVKVVSQRHEVWPGNPMKLGINGIALSPDAGTLYWNVTTV